MIRISLIAACLLAPNLLLGGEFNPDIDIGDAAPMWNELPGTDGKKHSSDDLQDFKSVVVAFTCNSCPYAADAEQRLIGLAKFCKDNNAVLVAINVNTIAADDLPAMTARAKEKAYPFPYLFDKTQAIAKAFGARYTPEFFVLGSDRKIVYMGSQDDSPDGKKVTKQFVRDAILAAVDGKDPALAETVPIGCRIRFERKRRTRKTK